MCSDGLHGFRYLRLSLGALPEDAPVTTAFGVVGISSLSLEFSGFLGTPDTFAGHFECSDEEVTQWWYDAVYTVDMYAPPPSWVMIRVSPALLASPGSDARRSTDLPRPRCTDVFLPNTTEPRGADSPTLRGKLVLHDGPKRDREYAAG